jgi:C4-dicarboxylate-specific signal transduction histidine kinase
MSAAESFSRRALFIAGAGFAVCLVFFTAVFLLIVKTVLAAAGSDLWRVSVVTALLFAAFCAAACAPVWAVVLTLLKKRADEEKDLKKRLAAAGRLNVMKELTGGIAHEMNQPLCVLRGYLELMGLAMQDSSELKDKGLETIFDTSLKSVDKISAIVARLREFVKFGKHSPVKTDFKEVVEAALSMFNQQLKSHGFEIKRRMDGDIPPVMLDRHRFELAVTNLLSNAKTAVEEKAALDKTMSKEITVRLFHRAEDGAVVFELEDNGAGMDPETLALCGEPFFTTKEDCAGLGLVIVEDAVTDDGGRLERRSEKGKGSVFSIILPAAK